MCSALFGGKQSVNTPEIKQVAPSATTITNADIDAGTTADTEAAKKENRNKATRQQDWRTLRRPIQSQHWGKKWRDYQ